MRHAQPLIAPGICYGALDLPADATATADSAQRLAAALPQRLHIHHSPLQRCELLAHIFKGLRPDLMFKTAPELVEFDFGCWEGRAWEDIPRTDIDAWTAQFANYRPGGGDNLAAMLARVSNALSAAQQECADGSDVLWITHAGVARCVQWLLQAAPEQIRRADQWPRSAPGYGEWVCFALPQATA
ncbi:histidine phosphatase family protein [Simplicispira psychrophila]|uniref:histidine phosphatase family protein n=1 Tax=Simplicispira psychrophila TaxID=80882 RepID=UPI000A8FEBE6